MPLCVAALIAALVAVPPLASAWDGSHGGLACSSLRLNRGVAAAVAKTKVKSLHPEVFGDAGAAGNGQQPLRILASASGVDEPPFASPASRSPETRRGPPDRLFR